MHPKSTFLFVKKRKDRKFYEKNKGKVREGRSHIRILAFVKYQRKINREILFINFGIPKECFKLNEIL